MALRFTFRQSEGSCHRWKVLRFSWYIDLTGFNVNVDRLRNYASLDRWVMPINFTHDKLSQNRQKTRQLIVLARADYSFFISTFYPLTFSPSFLAWTFYVAFETLKLSDVSCAKLVPLVRELTAKRYRRRRRDPREPLIKRHLLLNDFPVFSPVFATIPPSRRRG